MQLRKPVKTPKTYSNYETSFRVDNLSDEDLGQLLTRELEEHVSKYLIRSSENIRELEGGIQLFFYHKRDQGLIDSFEITHTEFNYPEAYVNFRIMVKPRRSIKVLEISLAVRI